MYTVLITGSRFYGNREAIKDSLEELKDKHGLNLMVVHGDAKGADSLASSLCDKMGIDQVKCPANWNGYKKPAGILRNIFMYDFFKPDLVFAFHEDLEKSKGTKHMISYSEKKGTKVVFHS